MARLLERNKDLTELQAIERIDAQFPLEKKIAKSHIYVDNSEGLEDLERQVRQKTIPSIKRMFAL